MTWKLLYYNGDYTGLYRDNGEYNGNYDLEPQYLNPYVGTPLWTEPFFQVFDHEAAELDKALVKS